MTISFPVQLIKKSIKIICQILFCLLINIWKLIDNLIKLIFLSPKTYQDLL